MSTRSVIFLTGPGKYGGTEGLRIYKHCDGYPTGNLPLILAALTRAKAQCEEHDRDYTNREIWPAAQIKPEQVAGLLIGEATGLYGIGAQIEEQFSETGTFDPSMLGSQWDLEWIYIVDCAAKTIGIYGGGYAGCGPDVHYAKGTVDPLKYADQLRAECQDDERKEIAKALEDLKALGWQVIPTGVKPELPAKPKRKRAAKSHGRPDMVIVKE